MYSVGVKKRTTIELDEELVLAAKALTGKGLRATVERALQELVAREQDSAAARRARIIDHLNHAQQHVDVDVLLSDQAWR